jgi:hypothetical protein
MEGEYTMTEMPVPEITGGRRSRRNTMKRKTMKRKTMKRKSRYGGTYFGMNKSKGTPSSKGTLSAKGTPHSKFGLNL